MNYRISMKKGQAQPHIRFRDPEAPYSLLKPEYRSRKSEPNAAVPPENGV